MGRSLFLIGIVLTIEEGRGDEKGAIYLVTKKGKKDFTQPKIDLESVQGLLKALKKPCQKCTFFSL